MVAKMLFVALFSVFSFLQSASVHLEVVGVDQNQVVAGERFRLRVRIEGGDRTTSNVSIDGFDNLESYGSSRSTSIALNNNSFSSTTTYEYDVALPGKGTFTIGQARIKHNGSPVTSSALTLTARGGQNTARRRHNHAGRRTHGGRGEKQHYHFAKCSMYTDKNSVVVGEPVLLVVELKSSRSITKIGMEKPQFSGFVVKELEQPEQEEIVENGQRLSVFRKKYILLPSKEGSITIPPVKMIYHVPLQRRSRVQRLFSHNFFSSIFGPSMARQQAQSTTVRIAGQAFLERG